MENQKDFEVEREMIEEKHRNEILNLLKSFEFERKDMEARIRQEFESKQSENEIYERALESEETEVNDLGPVVASSREEENEREVKFENEKEKLLLGITELEAMIHKQDDNNIASTGAEQSQSGQESKNEIKSNSSTPVELPTSESNTSKRKSLLELEQENKQLEVDLSKSREKIVELKNQVEDLTKTLEDVERLTEEGDLSPEKREQLSQMIKGVPRRTSSSDDVFKSPSDSAEVAKKCMDNMDSTFSPNKPHRTDSVLSFQLEELNLENEELKRRVEELEQKLRKTVEENEIRISVFNAKLDDLVEKILSEGNSETTEQPTSKMNWVEEINNISLEKTPNELLQEYVSIILKQKLTAPSPDVLNVNFTHDLQSLEQILDIEIFDGRVFDSEMKDEVKQVLRDKERELLVSYTVEKLRDEIRHRVTTEGTFEELQKERERDVCVHHAVNEILKAHLETSDDKTGHEKVDEQVSNGVSKVHVGSSGVDNEAVNKILREHLGIESDEVKNSILVEGDNAGEIESGSNDVESLKAEKENLERNLQELQEYFEKERQSWLDKLQSPIEGDSGDPADKDKIIQSLQAQKVLMEQILNTERFHLSRLYYMEMKEELEICLKQHQFDGNTKVEKDRLIDAWKHHAEIGDLYQEILSKETENLQNFQKKGEDTFENSHSPDDSSRDELKRERCRLEQQLPVKLELLELQRRRCRDHKAASLILEQAVVALETAAQKQDTLLISSDYFRRKSSWSSIEEEIENVRKEISPQLNEEGASEKDVASPNSSAELAENSKTKDILANALVKVFEKLLNNQQATNENQVDSCTSDSELSEVETSSHHDVPSDDEGSLKADNSENLEDVTSTNSSPRATVSKSTEEPEVHSELHEQTNPSTPVIYKLPPQIENILTIERFNMSRLLRDEYVDKIRRGREKLRRVRAKKEEKNGELVSKFEHEVKALLEGMEFEEAKEGERASIPPRRKLTATPSYDSGIVDPVEHDKDEVLKKYKGLLEKARRELDRAHRALRARNARSEEIKDEIGAMQRRSKEARNDLDELEEKRDELDHERDLLLRKINDAQTSSSVKGEEETSEVERDNEMSLRSELSSVDPGQQLITNSDAEGNSNVDRSELSKDHQSNEEEENRKIEEMQKKIEELCDEKMNTEEEVKELQRKLVAGTGGEEILKDLQEKLAEAQNEKTRLEDKCSKLEKETSEKDDKLTKEMKKKDDEVKELQRKFVSGSEGEDILKELQGKLENADDKKLEAEEKCIDLEKELKRKEEKIKKREEEMEDLERKSVQGTGAEEIVAKLQEKLNEAKAENVQGKEIREELERKVKEKDKELKSIEEQREQEVDELKRQLVAGIGGEKVLHDLQEKLKEVKEQNSCLEGRNSELQKQDEAKEKIFSNEVKKLEDEVNNLQMQLVAGTGEEEILKELQKKLQQVKEEKDNQEKRNTELQEELETKEKLFCDKERNMDHKISELQQKIVAGTGGEKILAQLQDENEKNKQEKADMIHKYEELEDKSKSKDKEFSDELKKKDNEINDLQKKLVNGTGGEEILAELQDKLKKAEEDKIILQDECKAQKDMLQAKHQGFKDEIKMKEDEISDLQKKLVSGTGGEEILAELQGKLNKTEQEKIALQDEFKAQEYMLLAKDKEFKVEMKNKEEEISDLQKKLVCGTGGEELLTELQDKLKIEKEEKAVLQDECKAQEDMLQTKDKEFKDKIRKKEDEISDLQKKVVSGTGGEEILTELQEKLKTEKEEKAILQDECKAQENMLQAKDKEFKEEIIRKDDEISDLQKKLVSGTGGEEILAELQNKLKKAEQEKTVLQDEFKAQEDMLQTKDKEFKDEIKSKENETSDLQKKLVSGTGGEALLVELQNKLKKAEQEKTVLQDQCKAQEDMFQAKDKEFKEEIIRKEDEISDLQKKLVSGIGGEEILSELQNKLKKAEQEKTVLQDEFKAQEDMLQTKDKELKEEIIRKDDEISDLQKRLVSGTGGEEILAEMQDKLKKAEQEKTVLQDGCQVREGMLQAKDKEFKDEIKKKEDEISDLQKKLVSGTGGEEILSELQDKLKKVEQEKTILQDEFKARENILLTKDKEFKEEIVNKDNEIQNLQRQLVSGTGCEEMLNELEEKLKVAKEENIELKEENSQLKENLDAEIKEFSNKIKQKDEEIFELQRKLMTGSGGEEILLRLQDKVKDAEEEKFKFRERCSELEKEVKLKDQELFNEKRKSAEEVKDLEKKLVNGTGSEEVLEKLQNKLEEAEREKESIKRKYTKLGEEARKEKAKSDEEISNLQKRLVRGGEDILDEIQTSLKETKLAKEKLERTCDELEEQLEKKDREVETKDQEINALQTKIVDGTGGEDLLKELQEKLRDGEESGRDLERKCSGLEKDLQEKERKFKDDRKSKMEEIEELQKKLVNGSGGEEVLLDLQDKLNKANQEKEILESRVADAKKDMDKMDAKFSKQLGEKQAEVNKLQKDLVEGTGVDDILSDLQEKLAASDRETKQLETKCRDLERERKEKHLKDEDGKEFKRLQAENKVLQNENSSKQEKINELQVKLVEGNGGEDVLKNLQNDLMEANKTNKELEIKIAELEEDKNEFSVEDHEVGIASLMEEKHELEATNKDMVRKIEDLQRNVVNGTGGEELLQQLQDEIRQLNFENKELQKMNREKGVLGRGGKDQNQLQKELTKANFEKERLVADNKRKENEIADLQKKLVSGSGGEELLEHLQDEIKSLKDRIEKMVNELDDLKDIKKELTGEMNEKRKLEKGLLKENEKLLEEADSKDKEIQELQKSIIEGSGAEELLKTLKDKVNETAEKNIMLEKKCSDLECDVDVLVEDKQTLERKAMDFSELEKEIQSLTQDCAEKDSKNTELKRKLVSGTGGEEILEDLQNQIKDLQEENKELKKQVRRDRKNEKAVDTLKKKGKKLDRKTPRRTGLQRGDDSLDDNVLASTNKASSNQAEKKEFVGHSTGDGTKLGDVDVIGETPMTYEQCLQALPEITEEKDYWKEKYESLRTKVGREFVEIIPEVWNEETELEKEREEIMSQLAEFRQEINEKETPAVKTISEKERIETNLSRVESDLEVCSANLEQLQDLQKEQKFIEKNEEKLEECLLELEIRTENLNENKRDDRKRSEAEIQVEVDIPRLERKLEELYNEVEELLAEKENSKRSKSAEKYTNCLVEEKFDTENDIKQIEAAIQKIEQDFSARNDLNQSICGSNLKDAAVDRYRQSGEVHKELEKVQQEINLLQSSLEIPSSSSGQEVSNLLALMKEKSKLEDELADTEKSLGQLGKREYEALVKERETNEKIAKKLLELTREKEAAEEELQDVKATAEEKEADLVKSFSMELKDQEATPSKKRRGFRRKKSSFELKSEDRASVSSAEEGFSEVELGEPPLSSEAALALSEELGSLIQKKSSLAVRMEGLSKEITAQSLKVEKSLLGMKDDPGGEPSPGESYVSTEDLTQSQMSIFDDYNMVDKLSLATNIVKDERVKRKSSRKAPMSKLLKEKSTLEKKLKDAQGKVLVQNTKVKNALKEGKDAGKAKEKFVQAANDRKVALDELSNVCRKMDELASEESFVKAKKAKTAKAGKTLSKNDKRRLLSQRESLGKQLDAIKKKIENFSVEGEDTGLADFPEMKEVGSTRNTIERLRELIAQEAALKQEIDGLIAKENSEMLGESSGLRSGVLSAEVAKEKVGKVGEQGKDIDKKVDERGSGMTSDSGDASSLDEGRASMLENDGKLGKRDDKYGYVKDADEASTSGTLGQSSDNKGTLKEMFKDLGNQVKRLSVSSASGDDQTIDRSSETELSSDTNLEDEKNSLAGKDGKDPGITAFSSRTLYSAKDTSQSSKEIVNPYSEVIDLLVKEKEKKLSKLRDLEKEIEKKKSGGDDTKDDNLVTQRKRENLHNKMKLALIELQQKKEGLEDSKDLLKQTMETNDEDPEQILEENYDSLSKEKDKLVTELTIVKQELDKQTQSGESLEDGSANYQLYKDIKAKEKSLVEALDKVNEKIHKRKEWLDVDETKKANETNMAETYRDILKRMSEENLNMADLIHELEETKETLSKEREITGELLDLIKSRVGNELLEALIGEGLHSPTIEIREMGMFGENEDQELVDREKNDTVTVAEVIDDYKKVNNYLFKENQKFHEKMELLKAKVDEDLFSAISDQADVDIDVSKKDEISKILENNKTLLEQIVLGCQSEQVVQMMEDQIRSLEMETQEVKERMLESDLDRTKEKVDDISRKLDGAKGKKEKLAERLKDLDKGLNSKSDIQSSRELMKESGESREQDRILEEIKSSLQEADELANRIDSEREILNEKLEEMGEAKIGKDESTIGKNKLGSELTKVVENRELTSEENKAQYHKDNKRYDDYQESNEALKGMISNLDNLQEAFVAKLGEVEDLEEKLKRDSDGRRIEHAVKKEEVQLESSMLSEEFNENESLKYKLADLEKEHEALKSKLQNAEELNEELRIDLEERKNIHDENIELKAKIQSLKNELEETIAKSSEVHEERDQIKQEFENLQNKNEAVVENLSSAEKENIELKQKIEELKHHDEELTTKLNESEQAKDVILVDLKRVEEERGTLKEMLSSLEEANEKTKENLENFKQEYEDVVAKMNDTNEQNKEFEREIENLKTERKSFEEKVRSLEDERVALGEEIRTLKHENEEGVVKLNELKEAVKQHEETIKGLEDENKSLKESMGSLEVENKEMNEKIQENDSIKDALTMLEKESNELIPKMQELEKSKKDLEDEVEYLRKEEKDFECLRERLKDAEVKRERIKEEVEGLKRNNKRIEDFVREEMNESMENGILLALKKINEDCKQNKAENKILKDEVKNLENLKHIVGGTLSKNLLELSEEELVFNDTQNIPKCLESLVKNKKSLAGVLSEYEDELENVKNHLGEDLLSVVADKELDNYESEEPLKMMDDLKNGKRLKDIIKDYEDLITSQAADRNDVAIIQDGERGSLDRATEGEHEKLNERLMDVEYEDLLKKVIEHQAEIEEAEKLLHSQRAKHETDKQKIIDGFTTEKTNMQELMKNERSSMEKAMQNLINEIVRLKEERNEIRKNTRIEKEKLVLSFENERTELLSSNEVVKNEMEEKLERKLRDDLEKAKKEMDARERELKEELMKIKTERNDLVSKVVEIEDKIGNEMNASEENEKLWLLKEKESKEQIQNEFEEKMKVEKKRFQETLNSLRQEIERLQRERSQAISDISAKQEHRLKQTTDIAANEVVMYERLESEFKAKMKAEKLFMESRVQELKNENEVLNQQKQDLKSSMRMERLELCKRFEKEKEELAEKYRNELKELRKSLEKTPTGHDVSSQATKNFYELRRKIKDRDTKIRRYETFFQELNQEASILQRDSV